MTSYDFFFRMYGYAHLSAHHTCTLGFKVAARIFNNSFSLSSSRQKIAQVQRSLIAVHSISSVGPPSLSRSNHMRMKINEEI